MTILDLLFLIAALAAAATLGAAAVLAFRRRRDRALRLLRRLGLAAAVYLVVSLGVSWASPQRVLKMGDEWCFDDWCLAVLDVHTSGADATATYVVDLRLHSKARRVSQRAGGAWILAMDAAGRRYAPEPDSSAVPLDVRLDPGQSVMTSRTFRVGRSVRGLSIVTGHGGPYCGPMDLLVIGAGGCLFGKPTMIRIR